MRVAGQLGRKTLFYCSVVVLLLLFYYYYIFLVSTRVLTYCSIVLLLPPENNEGQTRFLIVIKAGGITLRIIFARSLFLTPIHRTIEQYPTTRANPSSDLFPPQNNHRTLQEHSNNVTLSTLSNHGAHHATQAPARWHRT